MEIETRSEKTEHGFRDHDGFVGPIEPGNGPRSDPRGEFPTGPDIGSQMPNIHCLDADGAPFDLEQARGDHKAVFIFYRSAVW